MPIPKKILDLITASRVGLTNARDTPDILAALTPFGYDEIGLDEGLALVDTAEAEAERQKQEYAEQYVATNQLAEEFGAMRAKYLRHVRLARVAFKPGTEGYVTLRLRGDRPNGVSALLSEARSFYAPSRARRTSRPRWPRSRWTPPPSRRGSRRPTQWRRRR